MEEDSNMRGNMLTSFKVHWDGIQEGKHGWTYWYSIPLSPNVKITQHSVGHTDPKIVVADQIQIKHKIQCKLQGKIRDHSIYHLLFWGSEIAKTNSLWEENWSLTKWVGNKAVDHRLNKFTQLIGRSR